MGEALEHLLEARKKYAYGEQRDYFDNCHGIGWTRSGDEEHKGSGIAVVVSSFGEQEKKMCVGVEHKGCIFHPFWGYEEKEIGLEEREKSLDLNVGYDSIKKEWELIVRHFGSLLFFREEYGIQVTELLGNYSILRVPEDLIETIINRDEIIYVEKPNKIYFEVTKGVINTHFKI